jgi:hypothetical protein
LIFSKACGAGSSYFPDSLSEIYSYSKRIFMTMFRLEGAVG